MAAGDYLFGLRWMAATDDNNSCLLASHVVVNLGTLNLDSNHISMTRLLNNEIKYANSAAKVLLNLNT